MVDLRVFECHSYYNREATLVADDIQLVSEEQLPVNVVDVLRVNALAVPLGKPLVYRVLQHELRLILSFLLDGPRQPLAVRSAELRASARHIGAFFSESIGLGMLTGAALGYFGWTLDSRSIDHFDVMPTALLHSYARTGVRPDLLFRFGDDEDSRLLAGEARGRSAARPRKKEASAAQRNRLNQLLDWSDRHHRHPVTMTWTYTGSSQIEVDLFEVYLPHEEHVQPRQSEGQSSSKFHFRDITPPLSAETARAQVRKGTYDATELLYDTAPMFDARRSSWARGLRGSWVAADLFAATNVHLLMGVLDQALPVEVMENVRRRSRARLDSFDDDSIQIETLGRLLFVVARDRANRPSWSEVESRLTR